MAADALDALRSLVLGYDIDEPRARPLLAGLRAARAALPGDDQRRARRRAGRPADLRRPRRRCPATGAAPTGPGQRRRTEVHNPQEYLYAYLRSRDADGEGLPESFRARLGAALAHYGVPTWQPS